MPGAVPEGEHKFPHRTPVAVIIAGAVEYEARVWTLEGTLRAVAAVGFGSQRAEIPYEEPGVAIVPAEVLTGALQLALAFLESGGRMDCADCSDDPVARCPEHHPAGPAAWGYRDLLATLAAAQVPA